VLKTKVFKTINPQGCPACNFSGTTGRIVISEMLWIDSGIRDIIKRIGMT